MILCSLFSYLFLAHPGNSQADFCRAHSKEDYEVLGFLLRKKMSQVPNPVMLRHDPLSMALTDGGSTQYPEGVLHVPGSPKTNDRTIPKTKRNPPRIIIGALVEDIGSHVLPCWFVLDNY